MIRFYPEKWDDYSLRSVVEGLLLVNYVELGSSSLSIWNYIRSIHQTKRVKIYILVWPYSRGTHVVLMAFLRAAGRLLDAECVAAESRKQHNSRKSEGNCYPQISPEIFVNYSNGERFPTDWRAWQQYIGGVVGRGWGGKAQSHLERI